MSFERGIKIFGKYPPESEDEMYLYNINNVLRRGGYRHNLGLAA